MRSDRQTPVRERDDAHRVVTLHRGRDLRRAAWRAAPLRAPLAQFEAICASKREELARLLPHFSRKVNKMSFYQYVKSQDGLSHNLKVIGSNPIPATISPN